MKKMKAVIQAVNSQSDASKRAVEDEAMPVDFPPGLPEMVSGYLDGDIKPIQHRDQQAEYPSQSYARFRLFGRTLEDLMGDEAAIVGNLILQGEEKEVEQALALIRDKPDLLHCKTKAIDPLGRGVKGKTLLQIAAMAGDVDLKPGIVEEKDRGLVERLIAVGQLSQEEVAEQLKVITDDQAQQENKARNECFLAAIKKFGKSICEVKADEEFKQNCVVHINQLEEDLQAASKKAITAGYIFDPTILLEAAKWFEDNVKSFGGRCGWLSIKSDTFWVNGFGKLQSLLSSRDAHVVRVGISRFVDGGVVPSRLLSEPGQPSYFYNSSSRLGHDFYLAYFALVGLGAAPWEKRASAWALGPGSGTLSWNTYVEQKNISIAKLMQCPDNRSWLKSCLVM